MIDFLPKNDKRSLWIKLGVAALALRIVFGFFPSWCEYGYSRGLYPIIRNVLDVIFGWLPFAGVYLFVGVLLWYVPSILRAFWELVRLQKVKEHFFSFSAFVMGLLFFFLVIWGYNYARIPMATQLELTIPEFMDEKAIWSEAKFVKQQCITTRNQIPNLDTNAITAAYYPEALADTMRILVEAVLADYGYNVSGAVPGRQLYPKGILLHFSSSGVYFPFSGEGHIDSALPPVVKPFTMAHELGHGYGFGNEAECNFIGYLACVRSTNPAIRYAGYLTYWRYVYGELRTFLPPEEYTKERATISRGMYNDVENIYATIDAYLPYMPVVQQTAYDMFLRAQGVEEGIKSYNRMVFLVASWRKKYGSNQ